MAAPFRTAAIPFPPTCRSKPGRAERAISRCQQWQQDVNNTGGDRHAIIVAPGAGSIWETWLTKLTTSGWEASNGAKFDLNSNALRPAGWTSGDAAGLPMFPALVRYDECQRGMVEHALRIVVAKTRREYIYPATHYASSIPATSMNYPAMGQRVRLKASFVIPESWTIEEKAVLRALEKIWRARRGQRQFLFRLGLPRRSLRRELRSIIFRRSPSAISR